MYTRLADLYDVIYAAKDYATEARTLHGVIDRCARTPRIERRTLLEVSVGMGLAFFNAARKVGRQHVLDPYTADLRPVRDEGFGAYAARVSRPPGTPGSWTRRRSIDSWTCSPSTERCLTVFLRQTGCKILMGLECRAALFP